MHIENTIIIGSGPCGMSCAIELQTHGINPLIIEKGNVVNTLYHFPTHQVFFSSSEKLEIGDMLFTTEKQKPVRSQALSYYREVAERKQLRIHTYEKVTDIKKNKDIFEIYSQKNKSEIKYLAKHVIVATGYYDQPNFLKIPGGNLDKVMHYFKEAHPYYKKNIVIIGGKNSAVDTALELHKAGAKITVLYRGSKYSESIKPWILPEFDSLVKKDHISFEFNAEVTKITEDHVYYFVDGEVQKIANDFVFAMTGYQPNIKFLEQIGIHVHKETAKPSYDLETNETNLAGVYVAGVVASGYNNNEIFIENGRFDGKKIANAIMKK